MFIHLARAGTIYVNGTTGNDTNDGLSLSRPLATISRGAALLHGGDELLVAAGTYYERPRFQNLGSSAAKPVLIRAEQPGKVTISDMWKEAALGQAVWRNEGGGVFSALHEPALFGHYDGVFLFRYMSVIDLRRGIAATSRGDVVATPYGMTAEGGRLYVKLPGDVNPNGRSVLLSTPGSGEARRSATIVEVVGSPYVILDGFRIEGSGAQCAAFSKDSPFATVRNGVFSYCRYGAWLADDSRIEWTEYTYPGFREFAELVRQADGGLSGLFNVVKLYHRTPQGDLKNWMEGYIAGSSYLAPPSSRCELRYNFIHEAFDGEALGLFEYSESHHNVYMYNYDNHVQMEGSQARELRLHHNLFLASSFGPLSHQGPEVVGPHYVYRNVVFGLDEHGWSTWTQIKSDAPNADGGIFYYHNLIWGRGGSLFSDGDTMRRDMFVFRNNFLVFSSNTNRERGSFDSDHNLLINAIDKPWLRGVHGRYEGTDAAVIDFVDVAGLDFGILPGSPAQNSGVRLPGFNDGEVDGPDIGPFVAGEDPGREWPRPRRQHFTTTRPDRWNGPYGGAGDSGVVDGGGSDAGAGDGRVRDAGAGDAGTPRLRATAGRASAPIRIDGKLDETDWDLPFKLDRPVSGRSNNTAAFGVLWDEEYLYLGASVNDAQLSSDSSSPWQDDGIELYLDTEHNRSSTYDDGDYQYVLGLDAASFFERHGRVDGVVMGWSQTSVGYTMEVAISWTTLKLKPASDVVLGFDVGMNDDDNGGERDTQFMWSGTALNWQSTEGFGELALVDGVHTPPDPKPEPKGCGCASEDSSLAILALLLLSLRWAGASGRRHAIRRMPENRLPLRHVVG